jgi:RNA polymerase primary sigma factor
MYMPYAINLANKRGIRYDDEGNPIGNFVDDYTQAALIGIYEAAKHFDPTKNISFTTYAWYWMIQGFSEVFESSDIIRFPRNVMLLRNKISKTSGETITASISDLSKRYGQTEGAIQKALDCNRTISLDKTISTNNKEESLLADLADGHNVEKDVERINEREIVLDVIKNNLNEREQEFIYMRFGFNKNAPHTLKEIAQKVDMTTEGVRQAIKNALIKIVPDIVNKLGENYGEQDTEKVLKMLGTGKQ